MYNTFKKLLYMIYIYICKFCVLRYLAVSGRTYGNPISGQMEVIGLDCLHCDKNPRPHATWLVGEGLFMHPSDVMEQHRHHHTEL